MPQVRHCVFVRLKPTLPPAQVADLFQKLSGLQQKIPGLLDFSGGPDCSSEGLQKGFTHAFVMTFADEASRDAYLPHPEHEAVKLQLLDAIEGGVNGVCVVDYCV